MELGQGGSRQIEWPGIKRIIADELEYGAVEGVAATLRNDVHLASGSAPVFRGKDAGLHLKFRNGVDRRLITQGVVIGVDIDGAIQHEGHVIGSAARDAKA